MYQICCLSNWNAGGCGLDWGFLWFLLFSPFRGQNASTCSSARRYNRVHFFKELEKSCFFTQKLPSLFHTENSFKYAKTKEIQTKDALIWKLPICETATVGWWNPADWPPKLCCRQRLETPHLWGFYFFTHLLHIYDILYPWPIWTQIVTIFRKCRLFRSFWYKFVTIECKLKNT